MASNHHITVLYEIDGQLVQGFPLIRRKSTDEVQGPQKFERADGGGFVALPSAEMAELQVLLVKANEQVTLRLDGQSDAGIVINAGGFVLLFDVDIDDGASTNATLDNQSGSTATVELIAGGT